jgi:hypothetical protein
MELASCHYLTPRIWRWLLDFCKICGLCLPSELSDLDIYTNIFNDNFLVTVHSVENRHSKTMFVVFALFINYHL